MEKGTARRGNGAQSVPTVEDAEERTLGQRSVADEDEALVTFSHRSPTNTPPQLPQLLHKPRIVITDRHVSDVTEEAWLALESFNSPAFLFERGGRLVEVRIDERGPFIHEVREGDLFYHLERAADWRKLANGRLVPARVHRSHVLDMLARPTPPVPHLAGVTQVPQLQPSGTLAFREGYDPTVGIFLALPPGLRFRPVSEAPTPEEVTEALHWLDELFIDFPFVGASDRAHAKALLLLHFVRPFIQGPTPIHMVESPTPGTGKSLLVQIALTPALGPDIAMMTDGGSDAEWDKRITAALRAGDPFIIFDNLNSTIRASTLASAVTSDVRRDRQLGTHDGLRLSVRCGWVMTANNPSFTDECYRRSIFIRLNADMERPEERTSFRHADLRSWAANHRADLVWAALTIVQHWCACGMPRSEKRRGSFENWSAIMGGILESCGIEGFLDNVDAGRMASDDDAEAWSALFAEGAAVFRDDEFTADRLFDVGETEALLPHVFGNDRQGRRISFAKRLKQQRDRHHGGFVLRLAGRDGHGKKDMYRLEKSHPKGKGVAEA